MDTLTLIGNLVAEYGLFAVLITYLIWQREQSRTQTSKSQALDTEAEATQKSALAQIAIQQTELQKEYYQERLDTRDTISSMQLRITHLETQVEKLERGKARDKRTKYRALKFNAESDRIMRLIVVDSNQHRAQLGKKAIALPQKYEQAYKAIQNELQDKAA